MFYIKKLHMYFFQIILLSGVLLFCNGRRLEGREGDSCVKDGVTGVCRLADKCPSAIEGLKNHQKLQICGYKRTQPIVCCVNGQNPKSQSSQCQPIPENTATKTGRKAFDMCIEYQEQYVYPCEKSVTLTGNPSRGNHCHHDVDELILGGEVAHENEFPHMVMLRYGDERNKTQEALCGGAIISHDYILTAAHCIGYANQVVTHVIAGARTHSDAEKTGRRYNVKKIIIHPQYKSPSVYNDIALLEIEPILLSQFIVPACLDVGYAVNDTKVIATGWGQMTKQSSFSDDLRKVSISKFDEQKCVDLYETYRTFKEGIKSEQQSCYGDKGKDTCQGDSGGPIQIKSESIHCMYTLVGVTSFGPKHCEATDMPAIYTRLSYYTPWIESIVWP